MKIGILTLLEQLNYGGVLQAYALQEVLNEQGYQAEVIRFWHSSYNSALYGLLRREGYNPIKRWLRLALYACKRNYMFSDNTRRRGTSLFIKEYIRHSGREFRTSSELRFLPDLYDTIIVGSDQVWNPMLEESEAFLLQGISDNVKKLAYAASFGVMTLPSVHIDAYRSALSRFSAISCREKSGCKIVDVLLNSMTEWVVDPVLLFPPKKWWRLAKYEGRTDDYVFCYWLGNLEDLYELIQGISTNQKICVCLNGLNQYELIKGKLSNQLNALCKSGNVNLCLGAGPLEFLYLISHAKTVLSDSFHGMMFSCIFGKDARFYVGSNKLRQSMISRMVEFAEKSGMGNCLTNDCRDITAMHFNYSNIWNAVDMWRERSLVWLKTAL